MEILSTCRRAGSKTGPARPSFRLGINWAHGGRRLHRQHGIRGIRGFIRILPRMQRHNNDIQSSDQHVRMQASPLDDTIAIVAFYSESASVLCRGTDAMAAVPVAASHFHGAAWMQRIHRRQRQRSAFSAVSAVYDAFSLCRRVCRLRVSESDFNAAAL